ncbi:MAG TPA: hypothetical protein VMM77_10830 [Gemmatimonadaceae bacterium]|nr:hypothetical protein [Gemmatimonadaceae bacterium]
MKTPSEGPSGFGNREVNQGGADSVEKTSYVTGHTATPEAQKPEDAEAVPSLKSSGGLGAGIWVLVALSLAVLLYFGGALFG